MLAVSTISRRNKTLAVFFAVLFSAAIFIVFYGAATLNVTYVDWLYARASGEDEYLAQFTWELYRADDWRFPVGAMENILYGVKDNGGSILFQGSASLPLLISKLLRGILPEQFQYIGIWQFISFILLGGLSCGILIKYLKHPATCVVLAQLFAYMPSMIYRSYYHSCLCSQWVVLLPIFIRVYKEEYFYNTLRQLFAWVTAASVSILVFIYYVPVVFVAMVGFLLEDWIEERKFEKELLIFFSSFVAVIFIFWQLGGFLQIDNSSSAGGFGSYSANVLFPFDSGGYSQLIPDMPSGDQLHEGFTYFGISGIILLLVAFLITLYRGALTDGWLITIQKKKAILISSVFVYLATLFLAAGPRFFIGSKLVLDLTWCVPYVKLMSSFRSCGRIVWLCAYMLLFFAVITVFRSIRWNNAALVLASVLLVLQFCDIQPLLREKAARAPAGVEYIDPHETGFWADISDKVDHVFRLSYNHWSTPGTLEVYCARNGLTINNLYCPRNDDEANLNNIAEGIDAVMMGNLEKDTLYCILDDRAFTTVSMTGEDVVELHVDGYYVFIHKDLWNKLDQAKYQDIYMDNTGEYLTERVKYMADKSGSGV